MTTTTTFPPNVAPDAPAASDADLWTRVRRAFARYWEGESGLWRGGTWLGVPIQKMPADAWVYQELLFRLRPDLVIETGTLSGGSAYFFATLMDVYDHGHVISVDHNAAPRLPEHPRIDFWKADALDPTTVERLRQQIAARRAEKVLVILDDNHSADHVRAELDRYAPLVSVGSYLVVEDTTFDDTTVLGKTNGFGAAAALADWLPQHPEFVRDTYCERFILTTNAGGFLRRES